MKAQISKPMLAKRIGTGYFIAIALLNLSLDFIDKNFILKDWIFLAIVCLPLLISKRIFLIGYGMIAVILSSYIGMAVLMSFTNPNVQETAINWIVGGLLPLFALFASLLLLYAAFRNEDKNTFSLI